MAQPFPLVSFYFHSVQRILCQISKYVPSSGDFWENAKKAAQQGIHIYMATNQTIKAILMKYTADMYYTAAEKSGKIAEIMVTRFRF